jgi:hypothetical protein
VSRRKDDRVPGSVSPAVRYLIRASELDARPVGVPREHLVALRTVLDWIRKWVSYPNSALGRSGPVCPYTGPSLEKDLVMFAACAKEQASDSDLEGTVLALLGRFLDSEPREGPLAQLKTILTIVPDRSADAAAEMVERVQKRLQPTFVAKGLMLGQFYPTCGAGGLHNPEFRPLRAPVPLLGMRCMVPTDLPFLRDDARYMTVYLRLFGDRIPPPLRPMAHEAMKQLGLSDAISDANKVPRVT